MGGKKIAYLLAILAAFAVFAYLVTNGKASEAAEVSDQAPLGQNVSVDAAIPGVGNALTVGATAEVQIAGDILTDAASSLIIREPVPQNGQTTQTADMIKTGTYDVSNNVHAFSFWDRNLDNFGTAQATADDFGGLFEQGRIYSADVSRSSNPWNTKISNSGASRWDFVTQRYVPGEVIASSVGVTKSSVLPGHSFDSAINLQEGAGPSDDNLPASSSWRRRSRMAAYGAWSWWDCVWYKRYDRCQTQSLGPSSPDRAPGTAFALIDTPIGGNSGREDC